MGIDHTPAGSDDNAENAEQRPAADHRSPLPPDKPGTDGYPSRADSRAGAAAANNTDQPPATNAYEQKSGSADVMAESPDGAKPQAAEKKDPSVGSQLNEANHTDDGRTDLGAGPERPGERPAVGTTADGQATKTETGTASPEAPRVTAHLQSGKPPTGAEAKSSANTGERSVADRLMVDGKPLRERLDPVGAGTPPGGNKEEYERHVPPENAMWDDGVDRLSDLPTGGELANMESDKASRFERARKKGYEISGDVISAADKGADSVQSLLARKPPTGHPETRSPQPIIEAQHHGIDPGDAATALLMLGIVVGEGVRLFARHSRGRKTGS